MTDYKNTLNLPETPFQMKANLPAREPIQLSAWNSMNLYEKIRAKYKGKKRFVLHDGPPYANGHLHCGHALNKILKDIIIKSKTLSGFDAPFLPGFDCHGLPIELNVEKKIGKAGGKVDTNTFRSACRAYAQGQIAIQTEEFKRLGVLGSWDNPYATYDFSYEANIIRALAQIIKNGHLEQGFKPVHWCIACGSALAEAEVDYEEKTSLSIDVAFLVEDTEAFFNTYAERFTLKPVIVPIWTTTPWSLPGNEAVCFHPESLYALVDVGTHYFLMADDRVASTLHRYGITSHDTMFQLPGKVFAGLKLRHPFFDKIVPVIYGEHVTMDSGTGAVHTAPAHGPEDYAVSALFKLPLDNPVMMNGCYAEHVPYFAGLSVLKVDETIVLCLKEKGALLYQEMITHSYPHCWRHKTPMIFLATPQWFISMDKNGLRDQILNSLDAVSWMPEWGKARMQKMVGERPDWCISRQRAWGTPMALFVHKATRALHPDTLSLMEKVAEQVEKNGIDAWFDLEPSTLLGEDALDYEKVNDTLDVWFDSGVSHYSVLFQNDTLSLPADVYFEGSDQHRGWFNSSLTTAIAIYGKPPYKTVLTHGYTVDAQGKKLSKSQGNYIALDVLMKQFGADILRLWVSSTDYRHEVSISQEILKRVADAYRRIRNTMRFLLANLSDFNPEKDLIPGNELLALDQWIVNEAALLQSEILIAYDHYQFHVIYQKVHNFCAIDLGSFYLDVIKDRQYTLSKNSLARRSCQTAMFHILQALTRWLAPILSFTAEEVWQYIPGQVISSVFLDNWYDAFPTIPSIDRTFWRHIRLIRDEVNKAIEMVRQTGAIGSSLSAEIILYVEKSLSDRLAVLRDELRFVFISSKVVLKSLNEAAQSVNIHPDLHLGIEIIASPYEKCARCWHRVPGIGDNPEFPDICPRCIDNLKEPGETRYFA